MARETPFLPTEYDSDDSLCKQCAETEKGKNTEMPSSQPRPTPCLCGDGVVIAKAMIQCVQCVRWWHPACVGLEGLSKYGCNSIVNWHCPICFKFSPDVKEKFEDGEFDTENGSSASVTKEIKKQISEAVPAIVNEVVKGVKSALGDSQVGKMMKVANEKITQSWADITRNEQKKVIKEVVEKTSETALKKSICLIDANLSEQKKRVRNVVISNIAEDYGRDEDTSLSEVVVGVLDEEQLSTNDFVSCKRLGMKKPDHTRLVLVIFKREEDAMYFHNWGRGRKLTDGIWVNPDLTRTERDAMYQRRQERRIKQSSNREQPEHTGEGDRDGGSADRGRGQHRAAEGEHRAQAPGGRGTSSRRSNSR